MTIEEIAESIGYCGLVCKMCKLCDGCKIWEELLRETIIGRREYIKRNADQGIQYHKDNGLNWRL